MNRPEYKKCDLKYKCLTNPLIFCLYDVTKIISHSNIFKPFKNLVNDMVKELKDDETK